VAFGELGIAKVIAMNAPKHSKIVEPFADGGTIAMFPGMKKPKQHIVNIEDETIFNIMLFMQTYTAADKKNLKGRDWVASQETFDAALSINATDGTDLFYRFFYLKKFGVKAKDPEQEPTFDYLKLGHNMLNILFTLPIAKTSLKKATITNDDPLSLIAGAAGTFTILTPKKPEHIESVESKLPIGGDFFYAKKSMSNEAIFEAVDKGDMIVSAFSASSIMMATMEVRTNYEHKSREKLKILKSVENTPT